MKNYCVLLINKTTGEVEHCATHTEVIPVENYPSIPGSDYDIELYEFDCTAKDTPFIKAREVLDSITGIGPNVVLKSSSNERMCDFEKVVKFT